MTDGVRYLLPLILGSAILGLAMLALAAYRQIRPLRDPRWDNAEYGEPFDADTVRRIEATYYRGTR